MDLVDEELKKFVVNLDDFRLDKVIGRGGYGEIILAKNLKDHQNYAIKKLPFESLEGKNFVSFTREVSVLSKCNSRFILPFYGFTVTHPYSIITRYIPNGSLYDALHGKQGAPLLTPTSKTKIALCIAKGMQSLHELSIIHRDLKSLNILLDSDLLPKICDFGISRFKSNKDSVVTKQIGTPHWMAPEMFESTNYTNKVDVYAFGMLLWELETCEIPFKGFTAVQVCMVICKNRARPLIPENLPESLKDLITKCWSHDPEERPSFEEIYNEIITKKAYYQGTEEDEINLFVANMDEINKRESEKVEQESPSKQSPVQPSVKKGRRNIFLEETEHVCLSPPPAVDNIDEILSDPYNPYFVRIMQQSLGSVDANTCGKIFKKIYPLFSTQTSRDIIQFLLNELANLLKRFPGCSFEFVESGLHTRLPYFDSSFAYSSLSILHSVVQQNAAALTKEIARVIINFSESYSRQVLSIFSHYANAYGVLDKPLEVLDVLISYSTTFIGNKFGTGLCQILFYLQTNFASFQEQRGEYCFYIYVSVLYCANVRAVNEALGALAITHSIQRSKPKLIVPMDLLTKLLENALTTNRVLEYLIAIDKQDIKASQELIDNLIMHLNFEESFLVLSKIIDSDKEAASFMLKNTQWMDSTSTKWEYILELFLLIFENKEMRPFIFVAKEFVPFINRLCTCNDNDTLCNISNLLDKTLTGYLVDILRNGKFLERFYSVTSKHFDNDVVISGLRLFAHVCDFSFGDETNILLPHFKLWFVMDGAIQVESLKAAISLLKYKEAKQPFINHKAYEALKEMQISDETKELRNQLLQLCQ